MVKHRKQLKQAEHDIERLLLHFTKAVQHGADLSLATFKQVWAELQFSYIFWVRQQLLLCARK